jgi:hypothetical protein
VHAVLSPRTYLEVGVCDGDSLSFSRCRSIGIDPAFAVTRELVGPTQLVKKTSDAYFESLGTTRPLGKRPVDLAFIDGMHLFECAIRDFANIERFAEWSMVTIFDDVLPRDQDEPARYRHTEAWAGDIFRVPFAFEGDPSRPHLVTVDTQPTGLMLVFGLDPNSTVLGDRIGEPFGRHVAADPQVVPAEVIARSEALEPEMVLGLPVWEVLRAGRGVHSPAVGRGSILKALGLPPD